MNLFKMFINIIFYQQLKLERKFQGKKSKGIKEAK